ncbi:MAG TPA: uroporphyrinogen-III C-methyltransferase [Spirochaetota bacterium]|jgi:uroporphyrinogen III methyltransferase/synthase|nr:uroporphyrinogen-III C-methyltransferase [Spirochaetota bacterium]OQA97682.1 MAG: Uroporphyrinogen-III C-methyltransferase [Spirochaetes bacterium ADurb.Bin218]HOK02147.1 uroporphyrinogen-III C-methyltransferase [Spirochaetota bacterium]HOK93298.1 uroporphyrinogen-III C-methyltransferase [Spirochaetota bacterium]HON15135.1 uroporphyrinogen-III C-methyltransferase [Spirochaetota bacterium]
MKGIVYLVGAGPGDPELISIKGKRLLQEADCVIYDYLAEKSLVSDLRCELIYVGKQGSNHTMTQDEINSLMLSKALEGKKVVRLKGGDPFIFGRGGEEAEELAKAGIPFVVVPGISSFYSAPAYAGIPVTHRDFANAFEVISGHRRDDASEIDDVNFPEYDPEKTFVFLMGMKNLSHIKEKLINEKHFPPDTPVGIVSWGTRPQQRVLTATLNSIDIEVERTKMKPPAIIVMGGVVSLRERLRWFDNQPLFGKKIVVTRTREQASRLSSMLITLGAEVVEFPTIEIKREENLSTLHNALQNIDKYHWLVFTSQNAVNIFFEELFKIGKDSRTLGNIKIAVIGKASGDELKQYGLRPDLIPEEFVAESLIEKFSKIDIKHKKILLPCSADARPTLRDGLEKLGAEVNRIHIYSSQKPAKINDEILDMVKGADVVTFTSSSTVNNFFDIVNSCNGVFASIGPITTETLIKRGHEAEITAREYTIDGLVKALIEYFTEVKP